MAFTFERVKKIREYETIYITKPDITDEKLTEVMNGIVDVIKQNGGDILKTTLMGKRKFFFEIKGNLRGIYVHTIFVGGNNLIAEFERRLRINEEVVRYQTIKLHDNIKDVEQRKAYYNSPEYEELMGVISKPTKEVKDDYDKFKPKGAL